MENKQKNKNNDDNNQQFRERRCNFRDQYSTLHFPPIKLIIQRTPCTKISDQSVFDHDILTIRVQ
jgi:hypothetical protein